MTRPMQVFKIVPTVQQYDWGKIGTSSKVAVFAQSAGISDFRVDGSKPYAEVSVSVSGTNLMPCC
jgi:mannose-6-phosphate isomerase